MAPVFLNLFSTHNLVGCAFLAAVSFTSVELLVLSQTSQLVGDVFFPAQPQVLLHSLGKQSSPELPELYQELSVI